MHFLTLIPALLVLASPTFANPALVKEAVAEPVADMAVREAGAWRVPKHTNLARTLTIVTEPANLGARADDCKCAKVSNPGLYCGYCAAVTGGYSGRLDWVFWCNKKGGCDSIGYRKSCARGEGPCDGRDS